MDWVTGIVRGLSGTLMVAATSSEEGAVVKCLEDVKSNFSTSRDFRRRAVLSLKTLRRASAEGYLSAIGSDPSLSAAQPVYEADTAKGMVIIPAQLLLMELFGAAAAFRRILFTPLSVSSLITATWAEEGVEVAPAPSPILKRLGPPQVTERKAISVRNGSGRDEKSKLRAEWILTFPSVTAAWGSVYRHALRGRFDIDLPSADVDVALRCRAVNGKVFVTSVTVMVIRPTELPHPFAINSQRREFKMNESVNMRPRRRPRDTYVAPSKDESIRLNASNPKLSDAQWLNVESLVNKNYCLSGAGSSRRSSLRDVVDAVRLKLATPYSWSQLPVPPEMAYSARKMLSKLKRSGDWDRITEAAQRAG
jgi:hypothetical protein